MFLVDSRCTTNIIGKKIFNRLIETVKNVTAMKTCKVPWVMAQPFIGGSTFYDLVLSVIHSWQTKEKHHTRYIPPYTEGLQHGIFNYKWMDADVHW